MTNTADLQLIYREFQTLCLNHHKKCDGDVESLHDEWSKVRKSERAKKLSKIYNVLYKEGIIDNDINKLEKQINSKTSDKPSGKIFWITVNPNPSVKFEEFQKVVQKQICRSFVRCYIMAYEQRASLQNGKPLGTGFHVHILMERTPDSEPPNKIQKYIRAGFKNICNSNNNNILNFNNCPANYVDDKINYLINKNLDEDHKDKEQKQIYDKKFREQYKLQDLYISGEGDIISKYQNSLITL